MLNFSLFVGTNKSTRSLCNHLPVSILFSCFQAGIDKTRLAIVLESEAAYIFCKELPVEKFEDGSNNIDVFSTGQRYLVLNAEGKSQITAS